MDCESIYQNNVIGFACSEDGKPTQSVEKMSNFLIQKDIEVFREHLKSENTAYQFLSAFILDLMSENKEIKLSEKDEGLISKIKSSRSMVFVCSGCTYSMEEPLYVLFDTTREHLIYQEAVIWFNTNR